MARTIGPITPTGCGYSSLVTMGPQAAKLGLDSPASWQLGGLVSSWMPQVLTYKVGPVSTVALRDSDVL